MLGLGTASAGPGKASSKSNVHRHTRRAFRAIMRSYKFRLPKYDLPLRLRPWFIIFTTLVMLLFAFLGFTGFSHSLPLNDKVLHLVCLCFATIVFYFIFDVEDDARRIWIWRHAPLILSATVCFITGGIVSEVVQSILPYKELDLGDITANLVGSSLGLWIAYHLERYYRHRQEIARLYRPIALGPEELSGVSSEDEDEDQGGTMLLPMHYNRNSTSGRESTTPKAGKGRGLNMNNIWDEHEEPFGIGDSDEEGEETPRMHRSNSRSAEPSSTPQTDAGPKIVVTST